MRTISPPRTLATRLSFWTKVATSAYIAVGTVSAQAVCDLAPNQPDPVVLAEIQVWHGSDSHTEPFDTGCLGLSKPYDSQNPAVIDAQIEAARDQGIDGFVIDWYGPEALGWWWNNKERQFMDLATARLFEAAESVPGGFCLALLYDEGTLCEPESLCTDVMARAEADLAYLDATYLSSPAYLKLGGKPAVFVFPYPQVDPLLNWSVLRVAMSAHDVNLIDQDPNPDDPAHDAEFDGFFAWVQPSGAGWHPIGLEWGRDYLHWFYQTLASPLYASKLAVGGVWPGFDDALALWGLDRFMSRAGSEVYDLTRGLAKHYGARIVMASTWNDYEEGTDIESGVAMLVDMQATEPNPTEVLIRSSPLEATWDPAQGSRPFQVYQDCKLIYDRVHSPPVCVALEPQKAYELKVWLDGGPVARAVKIRSQDPHPDLIFRDGFESGDLSPWLSPVECTITLPSTQEVVGSQ